MLIETGALINTLTTLHKWDLDLSSYRRIMAVRFEMKEDDSRIYALWGKKRNDDHETMLSQTVGIQ